MADRIKVPVDIEDKEVLRRFLLELTNKVNQVNPIRTSSLPTFTVEDVENKEKLTSKLNEIIEILKN